MICVFIYCGSVVYIVFGVGKWVEIGVWVEKFGCKNVLVLLMLYQEVDVVNLFE